MQASSVQAWEDALEVVDDPLLDRDTLGAALDACSEQSRSSSNLRSDLGAISEQAAGKADIVERVDALTRLLRVLGARGSAGAEEAMSAMNYGTAARAALDAFLQSRGVDVDGDGSTPVDASTGASTRASMASAGNAARATPPAASVPIAKVERRLGRAVQLSMCVRSRRSRRSRRELLLLGVAAAPALASADITEWQDPRWASLGLEGTSVPLRSVESAAQSETIGEMGLYPDPLLRRTGSPVTSFGPAVEKVADLLVAGMKSNAITALQYGVDARMIALKGDASPRATPLVFINPTILSRSAESAMRPWREVCLVLPPALEIDLLRDDVVEVAAQDVRGVPFRTALRGEAARAFQHELDHLDGILIIDHAGLDELPRDIATLEAPFHESRQRRAFSRRVYEGNEPLYWGDGA